MSTGFGTLNNKVSADRILGKLTDEQQRTLEDLVHIAVYHGLVTRITTNPTMFKDGGLARLEMAEPLSFHRGTYHWAAQVAIDADGGFEIDRSDEELLDSISEIFELDIDASDRFVKVYKR